MSATRVPSLAVIVLNWNGWEDTYACLASLARVTRPAFEVILVDNGSAERLAPERLPAGLRVTPVELGRNLGYAGGNNAGLELAAGRGAEYALLLNNDTEVAPDFLERLVAALEADPNAGAAGPTIYYHARPAVIWSAGGAIDWRRGTTHMLHMDEEDRGQLGGAPRAVDFVTGCALLVRLSAVQAAGRLDPRFFAYYEETEWCVRLSRSGYHCLHVPAARAWHKIAPEAREASPAVHYYMTRNRLLFLRLARAGALPWVHTLAFDYGRTLLSWTLRPRWRGKADQRRAMLQAIRDFGLGRFAEWEPR